LPTICGVDAELTTLAKLLSLAALMAATIEYAEMVRRRLSHRASIALLVERERTGREGLVRVLLANATAHRERSASKR
jgi:hypothetical protein